MLARSSGRLFAPVSFGTHLSRSTIRLAAPCVARSRPAVRNFTSSIAAGNDVDQENVFRNTEFSRLHRLEYLLNEESEPRQETLIAQLQDADLVQLPLVFDSGRNWELPSSGFSLPRTSRFESDGELNAAFCSAHYMYNTFSFASDIQLRRFNKDVVMALDLRFRTMNPVLLFDPISRTSTIGLPAYIGIQPPFPANQNSERIIDLLQNYRSALMSDDEKLAAAQELRSLVIPYGFKRRVHAFSLHLFWLYETLRNASPNQILEGSVPSFSSGKMVPVNVRSAAKKRNVGRFSQARNTDGWTASEGSENPGSVDAEERKQASNTDGLSPDDPKQPEAGTFVGQDGDASSTEQRC